MDIKGRLISQETDHSCNPPRDTDRATIEISPDEIIKQGLIETLYGYSISEIPKIIDYAKSKGWKE